MKTYIVSISDSYGEIRQIIVKAVSRTAAAENANVRSGEFVECCVELN